MPQENEAHMKANGPARSGGPSTELLAEALTGLNGAPVEVHDLVRLTGGASRETWSFTQVTEHESRPLILRRDPPGRPGAPGSMRLEAAVISAAHQAGLAVPEVLLVDDGDVLGTAGLIMEHVPGETRPRRILGDDRFSEARLVLTKQVAEFFAGLHAIDPNTVSGLAQPDPLEDFQAAYDLVGQRRPIFDWAFAWLRQNKPPTNPGAIVHGDFRTGNLLVDETGLRAAIDWELVHIGDPLEDLSWLCVKAWRFREPAPVGGFGQLTELFEAYEEAGGQRIDPQAFNWWLVLNTLKWGVMCLTQAQAHLAGLVRSVELAAIGRRAAEQEWDLCELLAPELTEEISKGRNDEAARIQAEEPIKVTHDDADSGEAAVDGGFFGRPTAEELLQAVGEFLTDSVMKSDVPSIAFHGRVAANLVAALAREVAMGTEVAERYQRGLHQLGFKTHRQLSDHLRSGEAELENRELMSVLAEAAYDRCLVVNPRHLLL